MHTIAKLRAFLAATVELRFCIPDTDEVRYVQIVSVAQRFRKDRLHRPDDRVVMRHLLATCCYSRARLNRLLARVVE